MKTEVLYHLPVTIWPINQLYRIIRSTKPWAWAGISWCVVSA